MFRGASFGFFSHVVARVLHQGPGKTSAHHVGLQVDVADEASVTATIADLQPNPTSVEASLEYTRALALVDRAGDALLTELAGEVTGWPDAPSAADACAMLTPVSENFIPAGYR